MQLAHSTKTLLFVLVLFMFSQSRDIQLLIIKWLAWPQSCMAISITLHAISITNLFRDRVAGNILIKTIVVASFWYLLFYAPSCGFFNERVYTIQLEALWLFKVKAHLPYSRLLFRSLYLHTFMQCNCNMTCNNNLIT